MEAVANPRDATKRRHCLASSAVMNARDRTGQVDWARQHLEVTAFGPRSATIMESPGPSRPSTLRRAAPAAPSASNSRPARFSPVHRDASSTARPGQRRHRRAPAFAACFAHNHRLERSAGSLHAAHLREGFSPFFILSHPPSCCPEAERWRDRPDSLRMGDCGSRQCGGDEGTGLGPVPFHVNQGAGGLCQPNDGVERWRKVHVTFFPGLVIAINSSR